MTSHTYAHFAWFLTSVIFFFCIGPPKSQPVERLCMILLISQRVGLLQMHVPVTQAVAQLEQVHASSLEQAVVEAAASVDIGQGQAGQSSRNSTATPLPNSVSLCMHQFSLLFCFVFGGIIFY